MISHIVRLITPITKYNAPRKITLFIISAEINTIPKLPNRVKTHPKRDDAEPVSP